MIVTVGLDANREKLAMRLAICCPPSAGHLNPMMAIASELKKLGHQVTFITVVDQKAYVEAQGFEILLIDPKLAPPGSLTKIFDELSLLSGAQATLFTLEQFRRSIEILCVSLPSLLRSAAIQGLVIDQTSIGCESVADYLQIPYVSVANALSQNSDIIVPPWMTDWDYDPTLWAILRNQAGYTVTHWLGIVAFATLNYYRARWNLPLRWSLDELYSPLAQLAQIPESLDFPRSDLPEHFHYCGPFRRETVAEQTAFEFERLDGRPLVYASLGTLQNQQRFLFQAIAAACAELEVQLVISLGGRIVPSDDGQWSGDPIVVRYAPQLALLERAQVAITHAGMNTVVEALARGVPLVAIPIANDQPAIGARIRRAQVGITLSLAEANPERIRCALRAILSNQSYAQRAQAMQRAIRDLPGAAGAAQIIEKALSTNFVVA